MFDPPMRYDPHWRTKQSINGLGAVMTFVVTIIFAVAKFNEGAGIVIFVIPAMVFVFFRIHHHYQTVAGCCTRGRSSPAFAEHPVKTLVMVDDVHACTIHTINFAKSWAVLPWTALHVAIDPEKSERVRQHWIERIGDEAYLKILPVMNDWPRASIRGRVDDRDEGRLHPCHCRPPGDEQPDRAGAAPERRHHSQPGAARHSACGCHHRRLPVCRGGAGRPPRAGECADGGRARINIVS